MKPTILITLASGRTGFAVAHQLLTEGESVRIYVRTRDSRADELARLGAEVALGTFGDEQALRQALTGVERVYYCYPYKPGLPTDMALFIRLATAAGIRAVVFMGQRIAEFADTDSSLTRDIRTAYQMLDESGLNVVHFVPGYFADNVFVVSEQVLQLSLMPNMFGTGKNPWISTADMARCIAALLKNPDPYFGQKLFPTGPASLSARDIAGIFSRVLGRKIWLFSIPEWLFLKAGELIGPEYGFNRFAIVQAALYNRQMRMNRFDIEPTDVVKALTGREPESFEAIARAHFSRSRYARRTVGSWLRAFARFNWLPFVPIPSRRERQRINDGEA
jgi:NAD(P)H dehydrogenase (quinone)